MSQARPWQMLAMTQTKLGRPRTQGLVIEMLFKSYPKMQTERKVPAEATVGAQVPTLSAQPGAGPRPPSSPSGCCCPPPSCSDLLQVLPALQ